VFGDHAMCSVLTRRLWLSVNLQLVHYLYIYAYIYRLDSIGALHIHVICIRFRHTVASRWHCCSRLLLAFTLCYAAVTTASFLSRPCRPTFPFSSYTLNEDIFIGGVQHHPLRSVRRPTTFSIARPVDSARACVSLRYVD